ncbi:hypothetical protein CDL15_Pgr015234 [Punica granatum]|uniref:Uncharacterized protein n=1 Tax=Punica granatum TaxID=22663 RepID=A0A218VZW7_PUNGR|nr:hypothetical protein CDL15_Pgr015234 [Punica granatum]
MEASATEIGSFLALSEGVPAPEMLAALCSYYLPNSCPSLLISERRTVWSTAADNTQQAAVDERDKAGDAEAKNNAENKVISNQHLEAVEN